MKLPAWRDWPNGTRVAALCLAVALVADFFEIARMQRLHGAAPAASLQIGHAARIVRRAPDDAELAREAANRAPFDAAPTPTSIVAAGVMLQASVPAPPVRPRLVGTVVQEVGGGFVVLELPNATIQLVRIGERAGELRLRSVAAGEAVFDDLHGGRVSLRTSRVGSGPEIRP